MGTIHAKLARAALLVALDTLTGRQTATSHVATARNYLPRIAGRLQCSQP